MKVSKESASRFLVARQLLAPARSLQGGPDAVLEVLRRLGSIQLDQVDVGMTYNLTQDLMARVAGSWIRLAPEGGDDSQRIAVGAGLRWTLMRGVDLTLDYEYSHRFEGAGFDEADGHRVSAGATVYLR